MGTCRTGTHVYELCQPSQMWQLTQNIKYQLWSAVLLFACRVHMPALHGQLHDRFSSMV